MDLNHGSKLTFKPKISIGLPTYNGEKFIEKRIESLLSQTFKDFELIISDDGSKDSTPDICEEFTKKDKRIRFFRQKVNRGLTWNFNFLLQEARGDYFCWAAQDDITLPDFLEKNIHILELNPNLVGSTSRVEPYELPSDNLKADVIDVKFKKFLKKLRSLKPLGAYSISGSYDKKVRLYLTKSTCQVMYGLFRTEKLQQSFVTKKFMGNDWPVMLNVLKFGDLHVIDEVLMHRYGSLSESGMINIAKTMNGNFFGILFPFYPLIFWCAKNLGAKLFLKNIDYFIRLTFEGELSLLVDVIRVVTNKTVAK